MLSVTSTWIEAVFIALAAFCLHFGVYPLTFVLIPEIIPEKVSTSQFHSFLSIQIERRILIGKTSNFQNRIYGVTLVIGLWWAAMFGFSMSDAILASHLQHGIGTFLIVSIIFNLFCSIVFWFLVPQTKGKSYYEIFVDLNFEQT